MGHGCSGNYTFPLFSPLCQECSFGPASQIISLAQALIVVYSTRHCSGISCNSKHVGTCMKHPTSCEVTLYLLIFSLPQVPSRGQANENYEGKLGSHTLWTWFCYFCTQKIISVHMAGSLRSWMFSLCHRFSFQFRGESLLIGEYLSHRQPSGTKEKREKELMI